MNDGQPFASMPIHWAHLREVIGKYRRFARDKAPDNPKAKKIQDSANDESGCQNSQADKYQLLNRVMHGNCKERHGVVHVLFGGTRVIEYAAG